MTKPSKEFDRSQYKGTSVSKLNEKEQEVKSKIPQTGDGGRAGYHTIEEGVNYFRIYPAKRNEDTYIFPKVLSWLPAEIDEKEDKRKDKTKMPKTGIFNSKVHGNLKYDLVEEYARIATRRVREEIQDQEEQNKKLWPIISWRDGIAPQANWVCYAEKHSDPKNNKDTNKIFGRLEIWEGIYKDMKKMAAGMEEDDDVVSDPFSDPDKGKLLVITKTTKPKKGGGTTSTYDISMKWDRDYALTDDQLIKFGDAEGLSVMFVNSFKRSDFEKQIEGLRIFEERNDYGVFDDPEFIKIQDELDELIPEKEEDKKEEKGKTPVKSEKKEVKKEKVVEKAEETVEEKDIDDVDSMTRKELKDFIAKHKLPVTVTGKMDDEQIKELIIEEWQVLESKAEMNKGEDKDEDLDRINKGEHSEEGEGDEVDKKLEKYRKDKAKKK